MPVLTHVLAVRHGPAPWTPDESRPLSPEGMRLARRIPALVAGYPIDAIYSSPYTRARQTIEPVAQAQEKEIITLLDLRERALGEIGALSFGLAAERTWNQPAFAFPEGESNAAAQARAAAVFEELLARHRGGYVMIGSHGTLLALVFQHFDPQYGFHFWARMSMPDLHLLAFKEGRLIALTRLWQPPSPARD